MPAERYYLPEALYSNSFVSIKDQEYHHLVHVMRTKLKEPIEIVNGNGQLALGIVEKLEKKEAIVLISEVNSASKPTQEIILAQALSRQSHLELAVEKCTELGVTEIRLFPGARSEKKILSPSQMQRLHQLTIAAMKQCGRLFLPRLHNFPPLKEWAPDPSTLLFFGDMDETTPSFMSIQKGLKQANQTAFCIGPESGFSLEELMILTKLEGHKVKISPNILRTETAAIAGITLLLNL